MAIVSSIKPASTFGGKMLIQSINRMPTSLCLVLGLWATHAGCAQATPVPLEVEKSQNASIAPPSNDVGVFRSLFLAWKALDRPARSQVTLPSRRPVNSFRYTSSFGVRSDPFHGGAARHNGVDLAAPQGTQVHATGDGTVSRAMFASGYGNMIQLDHGADVQTRYGHLSRILVRPGQRVRTGDVIGLVGSTGRSTGSHLHYEVRVANLAVNPLPFMARGDEQLALQQTVGPGPRASTAMGGPDDTAD